MCTIYYTNLSYLNIDKKNGDDGRNQYDGKSVQNVWYIENMTIEWITKICLNVMMEQQKQKSELDVSFSF